MELSSTTHTIRAALVEAAREFEEAKVGAPRLTAEVLLAHALEQRKEWLYAHGGDPLADVDWERYGELVRARLAGKPTQYLTGEQEFFGRRFAVTSDVLIPRPETEHLVEAVLERLPREGAAVRIADIGTGSGAIAVTLALEADFAPGSQVIAADLSAAALRVASENARQLGAQGRVAFLQGDLLSCFGAASLDIVASNPPYIPEKDRKTLQREVRDHEPALALFGGPDGMVNYRALARQAVTVLRPGGWLIMELAFNAANRVRELLTPDRWAEVQVVEDLAGYPRVMAARLLAAGKSSL